MKHAIRTSLVLWSVTFFVIILFISLISTVYSRSFGEYLFSKNGTANKLLLSTDELNRSFDITLRYLWNSLDSLHFNITLTNGTVREFYRVFDSNPTSLCDEYAHMSEVKDLFITGKAITLISAIVWVLSSVFLLAKKKEIKKNDLKSSYITFIIIGIIVFIIGIYAAVDFDSFFTNFHLVFFPNGNWTFPYYSYMLIMFTDLLNGILFLTIGKFLILFGLGVALVIVFNKKYIKQI